MVPMRILLAALAGTSTIAVGASVFAIWPAVGDAPWEDEIAPAIEVVAEPVLATSWYYIYEERAESLSHLFIDELPACSFLRQSPDAKRTTEGADPIVEVRSRSEDAPPLSSRLEVMKVGEIPRTEQVTYSVIQVPVECLD